jgi:hypothetical protein
MGQVVMDCITVTMTAHTHKPHAQTTHTYTRITAIYPVDRITRVYRAVYNVIMTYIYTYHILITCTVKTVQRSAAHLQIDTDHTYMFCKAKAGSSRIKHACIHLQMSIHGRSLIQNIHLLSTQEGNSYRTSTYYLHKKVTHTEHPPAT